MAKEFKCPNPECRYEDHEVDANFCSACALDLREYQHVCVCGFHSLSQGKYCPMCGAAVTLGQFPSEA